MSMIASVCYLVVAIACAFIAERFMPARLPGGIFTTAWLGLIGAWVGGQLIHFGPNVAGVALIPCILGSAILVFGSSYFSRRSKRRGA